MANPSVTVDAVTEDAAKPDILIIEDEVQMRRLLTLTLKSAGYRVREAATGKTGLVEIATRQPEVIVLDIGLPDLNGVDVVRRVREWSRVPVLMLSVRSEEADKVAALDAGADDYVTKPFGGPELIARVRALLRRSDPGAAEIEPVIFGDISVDLAARLVRRSGAPVALTAREYAIFRLLVMNRGKLVTYRQILSDVWGPKAEGNSHYLRVHMTHLRQKLEASPARPRHLRTEAGIGYRLIIE